MNQILNTDYFKKLKLIFTIQFLISLILIVFEVINMIKTMKDKEEENRISKTVSINAKLNTIFSKDELKEDNLYFGRIICSKIGLDEYIYNNYSVDNLKVLPCKFYGNSFEEDGNICIIGHNYFDNRFFSNLNKLEINDKIILNDLNENQYEYAVYKKYEIDEKDVEQVIKSDVRKEITLCTCTFDKSKRLIIKAKLNKNL